MAGLTYAQKFSVSETVAEILNQNKQKFVDAGLEADNRYAKMQAKNKKVVETDAAQEKIKSDLTEATKIAVAAVDDGYGFASSSIDAMVGVLGKNDPLAKRLRKIREQMNKGGGLPPKTP